VLCPHKAVWAGAGRRHGLTGQAARCEEEPGEAAPRAAAPQRRRFSRAHTLAARSLRLPLAHTPCAGRWRVQGCGQRATANTARPLALLVLPLP